MYIQDGIKNSSSLFFLKDDGGICLLDEMTTRDATGVNTVPLLLLAAKTQSLGFGCFFQDSTRLLSLFEKTLEKIMSHPNELSHLADLWFAARSFSRTSPQDEREYWSCQAKEIMQHIMHEDGKNLHAKERTCALSRILVGNIPEFDGNPNKEFQLDISKKEFTELLNNLLSMEPNSDTAYRVISSRQSMPFRMKKGEIERLAGIILNEASPENNTFLGEISRDSVLMKAVSRDMFMDIMDRINLVGLSWQIGDVMDSARPIVPEVINRMPGIFRDNPLVKREIREGTIAPSVALSLLLHGNVPEDSDERALLVKAVSLKKNQAVAHAVMQQAVLTEPVPVVELLMEIYGTKSSMLASSARTLVKYPQLRGYRNLFQMMSHELRENPSAYAAKLFRDFATSMCGLSIISSPKMKDDKTIEEFIMLLSLNAGKYKDFPGYGTSGGELVDESGTEYQSHVEF